MVNPVDIGLRIAQALDGIGIKMGSYIGKSSNVKKAMFGGKSTMFKPNAIQSIRGEGGDFGTALKLIEEEAQYIVNATDAEKMPFLNNLGSPRNLLIMNPIRLLLSSESKTVFVPTKLAMTPPRSISPIIIVGIDNFVANPIFAISPSRRLISAGLPAPSTKMRSCFADKFINAFSTCGMSEPLIF